MHTAQPNVGDHVWIRQRRWQLDRIAREDGITRLEVSAPGAGRRTFLAPFDRPIAATPDRRPRRASANHAVARVAGVAGGTFGLRTLASAREARVEILPHQLEPALALQHGARRVLVADEVGLGKTIQAGLAITEVLRRRIAARILVLVPASLADQWQDELRGRFGVDCLSADRETLDARAREIASADSPWRRAGVWLASLDYVKQAHVLDAMPPCPWDLVVVDEAHTACGASDRHDACRAIAAGARAVLLLTATPHDGDERRFQRLLNLGRLPGAPDDMLIFRRSRRDLFAGQTRRVRWRRVQLGASELALLDALTQFERAVLRVAAAGRRDAALLLLSIFRKRALSTMSALAQSLRRRLAWVERCEAPLPASPAQCSLPFDDQDDLTAEEAAGLTADVGLDGRRERAWLKRVLALAEAARRNESKAASVLAFVARAREPIVVFTEFRDSLDVLRRRLDGRVATSCLHGGLSPGERRTELTRFLDGATTVLLATDVASLGLNLQSRTRCVVSLDLPWNPARLEQRAGRVDRIGQTRRVHVSLVVADHDAEAPVLMRLARRVLGVARSTGYDLGWASIVRGAAVRASVFLSAPMGEESTTEPPWQRSTRWSRPARGAAARLLRGRALQRHWRGPDEDAARPLWAHVDRLVVLRALAEDMLLIFAVPLIDGAGTMVERHIVGVSCRLAHASAREAPTIAAHARREAARALQPRARRLARLLAANANRAAARERALAAWLVDAHGVAEAQPGLFDWRGRRWLEQRREVVEAIQRDANARIADLEASAHVEIGRPSLVVALGWRP